MTQRNPPTTLASLTAPFPADDQDAFQDALARYAMMFPGMGLPFLRGVQPADQPLAIALLDGAVKAGEPLPWWSIMRVLGYPEPPPGVCP
jgi:hypothetical protein